MGSFPLSSSGSQTVSTTGLGCPWDSPPHHLRRLPSPWQCLLSEGAWHGMGIWGRAPGGISRLRAENVSVGVTRAAVKPGRLLPQLFSHLPHGAGKPAM